MEFIRELGHGLTKKALLYEKNGEKIIKLEAVRDSKKRPLLWQCRHEANITQNMPPIRCDIRTVHVKYKEGQWEVTANYVEGEPLTKELFASMTPAQKDQCLTDFAELLLTLHSLPVSKMDERYAEETDTRGPRYLLGAFLYKLYCFKKQYLSLKRPWRNPFATRGFMKVKERIYKKLSFNSEERKLTERLIHAINTTPEVFSYMGVCFVDLSSSNIIYDRSAERLAALDICGFYRGNIYYDFLGMLGWIGEEFTELSIRHYNKLAEQRNVHLPKCKAYPLRIDFTMLMHLRLLTVFRQLKEEKHKQWFLTQAAKLYPLHAEASSPA